MTRQVRIFEKPLLVTLDIAIVSLGFFLSFLILRSHLAPAWSNIRAYRNLAFLFFLLVPVTFHLLDLYNRWLHYSRTQLLYGIVVAVVTTLLCTLACGLCFDRLAFPRSVLLLAALLQILLIGVYRDLGRRVNRYWVAQRPAVIVGDSEESAQSAAQEFENTRNSSYVITRCIARRNLVFPYRELDGASSIVLTEGVKEKNDLILYCFRNRKELLLIPDIAELTAFSARARALRDQLMFGIEPHRLHLGHSLGKRVIDLAGAAALLCVACPLFLLMSVLIPITSRGPIFFRQERIGKGRRRFQILKFRTMVNQAEQRSGPVLATSTDPRITPLGRILRDFHIDEFPQLWNVLRGDMSLVGPRPEREVFVEQFEKTLPAYDLRHFVKPGLTGLAQVMGDYSTSVERKLRFDLLYIYNYSLLLDLRLLFQTITLVLCGQRFHGGSSMYPQPQPSLCTGAEMLPPADARSAGPPATFFPWSRAPVRESPHTYRDDNRSVLQPVAEPAIDPTEVTV